MNFRSDFPILNETVHGKPLVYLDNAATTQKPTQVLNKVTEIYETVNSNIHRAVHTLSQKCTIETEQARTTVQEFINAEHQHEIIFTRGTTEAINLVAFSLGELCHKGDEIIISTLEHHSNIVPWQMLAERKGLKIKVIPMDDKGVLDMKAYEALLSDKTAIVAVNHVSNALGTLNPIQHIIDKAHEFGAKVMIDGAQSIAHYKIDVQKLDCDFYAFSGHKIYAPTGIGALY
jgi:cysteine desulfurase/selenocysteine lyase